MFIFNKWAWINDPQHMYNKAKIHEITVKKIIQQLQKQQLNAT